MRAIRDDLDIPMPSMAPPDHGSYRVPRRSDGMDGNTKRMALVAGGLIGVFALFVGVWSFTGHRSKGVPVIEADSRPVRVKPDKAGGLQVAGEEEAILSGKADEKTAMAPAAEAPALQALRAQERAAALAAAPKPEPAPLVAPTPGPIATTAPAVPASVAPAPVASIGKPAAGAAAPHGPAKPQMAATVAPAPAAPPTAQAAPAKPIAATPAAPVITAPVITAPVTAPPVAASPVQAKPALAASGGVQVQLAALVSQEGANAEWQRMEKLAPAAFAGHKPEITKFEHDGKTFWRLRTTGFADAAAAGAFCEQVKAKVKGSGCSVARS